MRAYTHETQGARAVLNMEGYLPTRAPQQWRPIMWLAQLRSSKPTRTTRTQHYHTLPHTQGSTHMHAPNACSTHWYTYSVQEIILLRCGRVPVLLRVNNMFQQVCKQALEQHLTHLRSTQMLVPRVCVVCVAMYASPSEGRVHQRQGNTLLQRQHRHSVWALVF